MDPDKPRKPRKKSLDRISGLPLPVLHHILSFLPLKDVIRTGALSKTWNDVYISYPDFYFDDYRYEGSLEEFAICVNTSLNKFSAKKIRMRTFEVLFHAPVEPVTALITGWLALVLDMEVEHVIIGCNKPSVHRLSVLMPPLKFQFCSEKFTKFNSVKRVHIRSMVLDETTFQNLFTSCPLMEDLKLCHVSGLQRLHIPKVVERLRKVYIDSLHDICIDIETDSIRELTILDTYCGSFINNLATRFPVLENLQLIKCYWKKYDRVEILSPSLKILELKHNKCLPIINVDTPNLDSLRFSSEEDLPFFVTWVAPCQWEIDINCIPGYDIGTSWFVHLKNFLARSKQVIRLDCDFRRLDIKFSLGVANRTSLPSVPIVEKLYLAYDGGAGKTSEAGFVALLNGILWCCHPEMIFVEVKKSIMFFTRKLNFLRFLCKELKPKDNPLSCCRLTPVKCWRHDLKNVKQYESSDSRELCFELTW